MSAGNEARARAARKIAEELGALLEEKQLAYGDSGSIALGLWEARLRQYEDGPDHYRIPRALLRHLPRITRLDDRINRLVSNPAGDRMGEDPWIDAAGDCVIGALSTRPEATSGPPAEPRPKTARERLLGVAEEAGIGRSRRCFVVDCELEEGHLGDHLRVSAAGVREAFLRPPEGGPVHPRDVE